MNQKELEIITGKVIEETRRELNISDIFDGYRDDDKKTIGMLEPPQLGFFIVRELNRLYKKSEEYDPLNPNYIRLDSLVSDANVRVSRLSLEGIDGIMTFLFKSLSEAISLIQEEFEHEKEKLEEDKKIKEAKAFLEKSGHSVVSQTDVTNQPMEINQQPEQQNVNNDNKYSGYHGHHHLDYIGGSSDPNMDEKFLIIKKVGVGIVWLVGFLFVMIITGSVLEIVFVNSGNPELAERVGSVNSNLIEMVRIIGGFFVELFR